MSLSNQSDRQSDQPRVVCLIGSRRFFPEFAKTTHDLTSPVWMSYSEKSGTRSKRLRPRASDAHTP
jgi:hypothetical protein